ncbi:MAG TPA: FecR family protein, partial [Pyrinomonadaceae bacterium]|nr:FecR family protein [Pyrinomonadaceae bacterium]
MKGIRLWPHITVALVVALLAGLGVAFWIKQDRTASAEELPHAARIQRVDGEVAFADGLADSNANPEWVAATPNQPFSVGDRIYTRDNARTSLAFSGRNFARLDPNTSLDVVSLGDRRTQLALREGSAIFDVGYLAPGELFEVGTPYGAVNFDEPGLYNVGFDDNGGVLVSVLSGLAQVVGLGGTGQINKGEVLTLLGQTAAQIALSRLNGDDAGYLVDDYYRYQYPNTYDGRYSSYDAYLNDPYYYDPYRRYQSYQYVNSIIPGINDLDYYGDWQNVDGYGYAWRPRVDSGWVPYQQGYWVNDYPYGPTWVSSEPWGYAPYHYGRWANVGNQWYWIPAGVNTTPQYAPALVAFVPFDDVNQIGWVPLGPGDTYAPRYYDENWQPHYLTRATVLPAQLINIGIPDAVTVVPLDAFGRPIDPRVVRRIELQRLASVRSTLD